MSNPLKTPFLRNAGKWLCVSAGIALLTMPLLASAQTVGGHSGGKVIVQKPALSANVTALEQLQREFENRRTVLLQSPLYRELAEGNHPLAIAIRDNPDVALQFIRAGEAPGVYHLHNVNAAATIATDIVHPGGGSLYNRNGSRTTAGELGIWDGGWALSTHDELTGRITLGDAGPNTHWHSTHVAGTMIASGADPAALGMSFAAQGMTSYEWTTDDAEMAAAAAAGMFTSNHSYGTIVGWYWDGGQWIWYGDVNVSTVEDPDFGAYSQGARDWDVIAVNAPQYLIVKSSGNDRNDGPGGVVNHWHWDGSIPNWVWTNDFHGDDGQSGGYDTIGSKGNAKNVLTVGAVNDIPAGYVNPGSVVQTAFSSWGPTDDGRIKPDIVGNGASLWSAHDANNSAYATSSGTSMSSPNVSGSTNLLVQAWMFWGGRQSAGDEAPAPRSATIKAIVANTADEAGGAVGPDYQNGWGLMNTERAMDVVAHNATSNISENFPLLADMGAGETNLVKNTSDSFYFNVDSPNDIPKITIAWTDPAGTVAPFTVDPTASRLVNDLDIRITNLDNGVTHNPWRLNPAAPGNAATQGDNFRDNVEKINFYNPTPGNYEMRVTHKGGTLITGSQDYSVTWHDITPVQPPQPTPGSVISVDTHPQFPTNYAFAWDNASNGYYLKALKDYRVTSIGIKADLLEKQTMTVRIYEATDQVRGALLASSSATVYHPGAVYQYIPISFQFEECKEYNVNISFGEIRQLPGFIDGATPDPFDLAGTFRILNGEYNGNAGDGAFVRLSFIGSATNASYVQDLDPMQGTTKLNGGGPADSNQGRGFFFRANETVSMCAFGMEVDHNAGNILTANLYAATGTTRGALLATGQVTTSGSGLIWHDVPINHVLQEGAEYDLEMFLGNTTLWHWWNEGLLTMPFVMGPLEIVDAHLDGGTSNVALAHFRVHYDEGVGATPLDITQPFLTGTNPGSSVGGFDFGHFVTALRDQELTTVGWMADIPLGQSITINVFDAAGLVRGAPVASGTLVSNGPGMRFHDVPVSASLVAGQDYDIAIDWTGAPGAAFNFWQFPVHSPYNAYGMFSVYGSEFGGTPAGGGEYVHMRVNSCLTGLATDVEPRRNGPVPFALHAPYPNPVSSTATIDFTLDREASVTMNVYDVAGRRVATLIENEARPAGLSSVNFNTRQLPTGIYFVKMQTAAKSVTRKITVMR